MSTLFSEFRRRNVFRVAALYVLSAWLIAQVAGVVIGLGGLPPGIGRVVLVILLLGFPVAVALAWFFEWTSKGIRRETEIAGAPIATQPARRRADYVILALLLVALGYFAATHDWNPTPPVGGASIAVLPFEHRSAQQDDLYFTDGIHEDILNQLGKISSLVVISRTSVLQYRDADKTIPEIAAELGVATILEGGVQRAGNRVRINLQLVDAASGRHVWSENYDRELSAENVFAIQSEVAASITDALQAQLLPAERRNIETVPTHNLEAYDAYLLGRRDLATRRAEELARARTYFERAIRLDPTFALAYTGLADTSMLLTAYGLSAEKEVLAELIADAEAAARKALELNPELGEAHTSFGLVMDFKGDPPTEYGPSLQRGVELAPGSADARKWYSGYLRDLNRKEEALEQLLKAAQLDPMSPIIRVNLSELLWGLDRREEALVQSRRALEIDPRFGPASFQAWKYGAVEQILVSLSGTYASDARDMREFALHYLTLDDGARAGQWAAATDRAAPGSTSALIANLNVSVHGSQQAAAQQAAQEMLEFEGGITFPSRVLLTYDLRDGKPETALARYQERHPALLGEDPHVEDNYAIATDVAMLFQALGEPDKATRLLERGLEFVTRSRGGSVTYEGPQLARIHALSGRREEALAALRSAIEAGWNFQWWFYLKQDPAFDAIREDPRFQLMVDELSAKMASQLAKVRQLEASGMIALPPGP